MVVKVIFDIFGHLPWLCQFPRILGGGFANFIKAKARIPFYQRNAYASIDIHR